MCGYVCVGVYGLILRTPQDPQSPTCGRLPHSESQEGLQTHDSGENLSSPSLRSVSLWFSPELLL